MNKLYLTAIHEAGHAIAAIIAKKKFYSVSIEPNGDSAGRLIRKGRNEQYWSGLYFYEPGDFGKFFTNDFISVAGYVAVIFKRKMNKQKFVSIDRIAAHADFTNMAEFKGFCLDERLNGKYFEFLVEYASRALSMRWDEVEIVADALITNKTLKYIEVKALIKDNLINKMKQP